MNLPISFGQITGFSTKPNMKSYTDNWQRL